jgi:hypothetical protein
MRHLISTIQFAQGWLGNELANAANDITANDGDTTIAKKVMEQWQVIDEGLDDVLRENANLRRKVQLMREALAL